MKRRARLPLTAFCLVAWSAGASPAAPITGRVIDSRGESVSGAKVVWFAWRSPERVLLDRTKGVDPPPAGETATDADGRFRVSPKPGQEVSLRVSPAGLSSVELEGPLDASEESGELEVIVPRPRRISGRVTDPSGKPLSGVRVRVRVDPDAVEGDGVPFDETRSGPNGSFALAAAPEGETLSLSFFLPGYAPETVYAGSSKTARRVILERGGAVEGRVLDPAGEAVSGAIVTAGLVASRTDESGQFRFDALSSGPATLQTVWKEDLVARREGLPVRTGHTVHADLRLTRSAWLAGTVVDEKTRRPIGGARVAASEADRAWRVGSPAGSVRTDARGRFRLSGLLARDYAVTASRRDYLPATLPGIVARPARPASIVIALRHAATLSGRVIDEKGNPVAGARVAFVPGRGRRTLLAGPLVSPKSAAVTEKDGSFRLLGVPPDPSVSIEAKKEGFVPARRDGIPAAAEKVKPVTLVLGRGLEARGRVTDHDGEPVAGAEVAVTRAGEGIHRAGGVTWFSGFDESAAIRAETDTEGRFAVKALRPGRYAARVSASGYATKTFPGLSVEEKGAATWDALVLEPPAPVAGVVRNSKGDPIAGASVSAFGQGEVEEEAQTDVEGKFRLGKYAENTSVFLSVRADGYARAERGVKAPARDLVVILSTAGSIRGRVEDAETRGPVEAFSLSYGTPRGSNRSYRESRDFRSPDGSFEVADVRPGKIEIGASAAGYVGGEMTGIEVGEGEEKEGIVLSLEKGKTITGRVLDPVRGAGVPNATVSWSRSGGDAARGLAIGPGGFFAMVPNAATTDADGRFRYEGVPPEKLVFRASHPDFLETQKSLDASSETTVELTLSQGASIAGTVVGKDGRTPVGGAEVSLEEQGTSPSAWTGDDTRSDASGDFLFQHLKEGRYRVSARSRASRTPARDVVLSADQHEDGVLLQIRNGALLQGRVTGLAPEKLGGISVSVSSENTEDSTETDGTGQFTISDVPAGALRVRASTGLFGISKSVWKNVDVPDGAPEVSVEIAFEGSSTLSARVTRNDSPVPAVYLGLAPDPPASGEFRATGQTDGDGRYRFDGVPDGNYRLSGSGENVMFSRSVAVSGDSAIDVTLGGGSISGAVTDSSSGEPLSDVVVTAETGQESSRFEAKRSLTDSGGRYEIDGLDPGSYQATARRHGYRQKTLPVSVQDSPVTLDFPLARGGGLTLRVTDGLTGLPLRGIEALAFPASGATPFQGSVSLDASGAGEVSLSAGTYSVYVFSAGYAPRAFPAVTVPSPVFGVSMTPGGRVEVRTDSAVTGRIVDGSGAICLLSPWRLDGRVTAAPPVTAWEHLAPGPYRLIVAAAAGEKSHPFTVVEGQTTRLDLP